jgi:preprotein translocase subunit SecD
MERKTFGRGVVLFLILAFCGAMLLPTFVPEERLPRWFSRVFSNKINLGLDLQGGSHIVYGINLDKAIDDKGSDIKRAIESQLRADGIITAAGTGGKVTTPSVAAGAVTVVVDDEAKRAEVKTQIQKDYGSMIVDRPCAPSDPAGAICIRVSSDFADGIRQAALRNAVNTIRERIDERGVAEATRHREGRGHHRRAARPRQEAHRGRQGHHRAHRQARVQDGDRGRPVDAGAVRQGRLQARQEV